MLVVVAVVNGFECMYVIFKREGVDEKVLDVVASVLDIVVGVWVYSFFGSMFMSRAWLRVSCFLLILVHVRRIIFLLSVFCGNEHASLLLLILHFPEECV